MNPIPTSNLAVVFVYTFVMNDLAGFLTFQPAEAGSINHIVESATVCDEAGVGTVVGADTCAVVGCTSAIVGTSSGTGFSPGITSIGSVCGSSTFSSFTGKVVFRFRWANVQKETS